MATNRDSSVKIDPEDLKTVVKLSVLEAFTESETLEKVQKVMAPLLLPYKEALNTAAQEIDSLKTKMADKDQIIQKLTRQVEDIETKYDDLEQHGRKGSVRVFGIPENTTGNTDTKVLNIINNMMQLSPPITIDDLEVTHRVGNVTSPSEPADQAAVVAHASAAPTGPPGHSEGQMASSSSSSPTPVLTDPASDGRSLASSQGTARTPASPRPILVKFASRRVKSRVMESRKNLKGKTCQDAKGRETKVFIQDDLTQRRAKLAFRAREMKRSNLITVSFGKIIIKNRYGRIEDVNTEQELNKYQPN